MERNRIVSGLSLGTLVIEAAFRSGTSVTARLAILQNKKLFALPHEIWNSHGVGTNILLRNGAIAVTCVEDIFQEIKSLKKYIKKLKDIQTIDLSSLESSCNLFQNFSNTSTYSSELNMDTNHPLNLDDTSPLLSSISSNTAQEHALVHKKKLNNTKFEDIYALISTEPISINEICKITSKSVAEVYSSLFTLELEGYIKRVAGGYVCILDK